MAELRALKGKRGSIKAKLTRFATFINDEASNQKITEIERRLKGIEPLINEFEEVHSQIFEIDADSAKDEDLTSFENDFYRITTAAQEKIQTNHALQTTQVKLPDIELPIFTGIFTEWVTFRDTFKNLIHNNKNLSGIQKFHYLNTCLKGEARQTIQHLTVTNENYPKAWDILEARFENSRLIVQHHVRELFALNAATKDPKSLRNLLQATTTHLKVLESLERPIDQWDDLLIHILVTKCDPTTTLAWESTLNCEVPTYKQFEQFLTQRCQALESIEFTKSASKPNTSSHFPKRVQTNTNCVICGQPHLLYQCRTFLSMSTSQRLTEVSKHKLCKNCLRPNHRAESCNSSRCRTCNSKHNTLLHITNQENVPSTSSLTNHCAYVNVRNTILSTARITAYDKEGTPVELRAFLDSGAQSNFITESACKKLQLRLKDIHLEIKGINQIATAVRKQTNVKIKSNCTAFNATLSCLVSPKITDKLPIVSIDHSRLNIPKNLQLADPEFHRSSDIDILIGNELFLSLLCVGQIKTANGLIFQKTKLGWVAGGNINIANETAHSAICNVSQVNDIDNLDHQLREFWKIESFDHSPELKTEDLQCERIFTETTSRQPNGKFVVKLPFKKYPPQLGTSYDGAIKRFYNLERKFQRDADFRAEYNTFMSQYLESQQMELVAPVGKNSDPGLSCYLAHHGVIKPESTTTRLRVVFDASAKTTNGKSLNDNLLIGPRLQQELFSILVRFRTHKYVLTADIAQMYRRIDVAPEHRDFQRILWRFHPDEPIQIYRLNTVTFGLASSPFLAIRCLQELAQTESLNFPNSARIVLRDFYVDDLLTGGSTLQEVCQIREELNELLSRGGFELRKWSSNILELNENSHKNINLLDQSDKKTLGLLWNTKRDTFRFSADNIPISDKVTKRTILSTIARLFDPMGLITPITVTAKILLQHIWALKLDWDESLPLDMHSTWLSFLRDFQNINDIRIPRNIIPQESPIQLQIHGFSDSSQKSYGACVYMVCTFANGTYTSHLICSKNRVAPLRTITIPRLELCAAVLLVQLINKLKRTLDLPISDCYYWSDSEVVLAWIRNDPNKLKIFVANRVTKIQELSKSSEWRYVNTKDNPADLLSRGVSSKRLQETSLWWHGPTFLKQSPSHWPNKIINKLPNTKMSEFRTTVCCVNQVKQPFNLITKFSSFTKLLRVTAYCLRFVHNLRNRNDRTQGYLSCQELERAHTTIIRLTQDETFHLEIHHLQQSKELPRESKLLSLNPFIDQNGLLRVGGRLRNSRLAYDTKFPIVLAKSHFVTQLIINHFHVNQLHAGCQATLAAIRTKYWPIAGRDVVRQVLHKCVACFRAKPKTYEQLMGDLPERRVQPARAFINTAVDYAGPLTIKNGYGRTTRTMKAYTVIFVCQVTKAVHFELVCDCTTSNFLNALKRFMSRRGKVSTITSDNARNFLGADRELREIHNFVRSEVFASKVISNLANQGITWIFLPPRAPHFGGLHEAAVKSAKFHLKRVAKGTTLNYDEMYTLLTMVEACLNSRPLSPLSNDPTDLQALTPGHFLIGAPLTAPIEAGLLEIATTRLSKYQELEKRRQHFWKRWSTEVVTQLQQRNKWTATKRHQPQLGDMVLIKEDNVPPLQWALGRIVELHPGRDGLTRVVFVKTARGIVKRPVVKVCGLPVEQ